MRRVISILLLLPLMLLAREPVHAGEDFWKALGAPGHVVLMRHAEAPGFGDPPTLRIGDCATQRNLDDTGRAQARAIGMKLEQRGIGFDRVLSSQWCRCLETAELVSRRTPEELASLNSFFGDRSLAPARVAALQDFLKGLEQGERVLMVTHQVVIQALAGTSTASGEMVVVRIGDGGKVQLVAKGRVE